MEGILFQLWVIEFIALIEMRKFAKKLGQFCNGLMERRQDKVSLVGLVMFWDIYHLYMQMDLFQV